MPVDPSSLGFLDFEAEAERAMKRMTKRLGEMGAEIERIGDTFGRSAPRIPALANASAATKQSELREVGNRVDGHAAKLEAIQSLFRVDIEAMTTNYLNRLDYVDAEGASTLRPTFAGMSDAVDGARPSTVGMRDAALGLRAKNVQQSVNLACERLADSLQRIVSDMDTVKRFTTAALRKLDDKIISASVARPTGSAPNRHARRRTR